VFTTNATNATYYVKELTAGKGYLIDTSVHSVVLENADKQVTLTDTPATDPLGWSMCKVNANNFDSVTGLAMNGAEFTIKYYARTDIATTADLSKLTEAPTATVVLTTAPNAQGYSEITISSAALRSKSDYFKNIVAGYDTLPLGTYAITETKAPTGYVAATGTYAFVIYLPEGATSAIDIKNRQLGNNTFYHTLSNNNVAVYEPTRNGYASFEKVVTSNNGLAQLAPELYNLDGTTYEIRVDNDAKKVYATVTFDADGKIKSVNYNPSITVTEDMRWKAGDTSILLPYTEEKQGNYVFVETHSARGFYLDPTEHAFTVTEENTKDNPYQVSVSDTPIFTTFGGFTKRFTSEAVSAATTTAQDTLNVFPRGGVTFKVTYYPQIFATQTEVDAYLASLPEGQLANSYSWSATSDGSGNFTLKPDALTSETQANIDTKSLVGLFKTTDGKYVIPQGTLVISEVAVSSAMADAGVTVNKTSWVVPIQFGSDIVAGSNADPANSVCFNNTNNPLTSYSDEHDYYNAYQPSVSSNAVSVNGNKELLAAAGQKVNETLTYVNFFTGFKYQITTWAVSVDAEGKQTVISGSEVTTYLDLTTSTENNGSVVIPMTINCANLDGQKVVIFDTVKVYDKETKTYKVFLNHSDVTDADQTLTIPTLATTLLSQAVEKYEPTYTDGAGYTHHLTNGTAVTLVDTCVCSNLNIGQSYTITGTLKLTSTGESFTDADGKAYTATTTFTATSTNQTVEVIFKNVDTTTLSTSIVAFEDLSHNGASIATHCDLNDVNQRVFPSTITTVLTYEGVHSIPMQDYVTLVDKVSFTNLIKGNTYTLTGSLVDGVGAPVLDKNGKPIIVTKTFTASGTESSLNGKTVVAGSVDVTFVDVPYTAFDKNNYVVAFESLAYGNAVIAKHEDINDVEQTVYVPKIRTTVKDADGNANVKLDGTDTNATLIDTVTYENLVPGKEYTVTGKLVYNRDYAEGEEYEYVKDANGNVITASTTFTPSAENSTINKDVLASGSVDVKFVFDASLIAGKKVTVFEDMYLEKVSVATHSDITDEHQTFETGMKLHVKLVKSDFDNHEHVLKNAEISIYVDENCTQLAKDINGNDCVGTTNENGEVEFTILTYDENQTFYAKETKAPFGYKICDTVIPIKGTAYYTSTSDTTDYTETDTSTESAGVCAINLKMFDKIIVIPPKTGDNLPILPIAIAALLGILCIGAFFATKKKKVTVDNDASTNVDEEEVEDSVIGLTTEDIDGDAHNGSGF
jgi:hypothetical protein